MGTWWWNNPEAWDRAVFKRVPQGWIYRSPIQWVPFGIGQASYFLLNDAQKDRITRILRGAQWYVVAALLTLFLPAYIVAWTFRALAFSSPLSAALIVALGILALQYALALAYWLLLRKPLSEAQPTSERITFGEQFEAIAGTVPRALLIFYAVFFCALMVFFGYGAFRTGMGDLTSLTAIILLGVPAAAIIAALVVRRRARQRAARAG
ncbi:MAG: hypothetical protein WCE79_15600 [Xanthobacteraceae bacterium]